MQKTVLFAAIAMMAQIFTASHVVANAEEIMEFNWISTGF